MRCSQNKSQPMRMHLHSVVPKKWAPSLMSMHLYITSGIRDPWTPLNSWESPYCPVKDLNEVAFLISPSIPCHFLCPSFYTETKSWAQTEVPQKLFVQHHISNLWTLCPDFKGSMKVTENHTFEANLPEFTFLLIMWVQNSEFPFSTHSLHFLSLSSNMLPTS